MTLKQVEQKLKHARQTAKNANVEVARLKQLVMDLGGELHPERRILISRNKEIYRRWTKGERFADLGRDYKLSATSISNICSRIDRVLETPKAPRYAGFADLLRYKKKAVQHIVKRGPKKSRSLLNDLS